MGIVYSLSKVTIIAASSTSCHSGFLSDSRGRIDLFASREPVFQICARLYSGTGFHADLNSKADPLASRGWAYQEEFLSSRYIKFTKEDVQWKCKAGHTCLCGLQPNVEYENQWESGRILFKHRWKSMVEGFSHRQFTVETDTLLAFSGMARRMASYFPSPLFGCPDYIAGLWAGDMVSQLPWRTPKTNTNARCHKRYVAPSFSWASLAMDGESTIEFPGSDHENTLATFIDARCEPDFDSNEFGKIKPGAFIVLRGPLLHCIMSDPSYHGRKNDPENQGFSITRDVSGWPANLEVYAEFMDFPLSGFLTPDGKRGVRRAVTKRPEQHFDGADVYVLLLTAHWFGAPAGLLLTPRHDEGGGYQRIGCVDLRGEPDNILGLQEQCKNWMAEVTIF